MWQFSTSRNKIKHRYKNQIVEIPSRRKLFKYLSFDRNVNSIQLITIKFSSTRGMGAQLRRNCFPYILQKRCLRTHSSKSKSKQEERDFSEEKHSTFLLFSPPKRPLCKTYVSNGRTPLHL